VAQVKRAVQERVSAVRLEVVELQATMMAWGQMKFTALDGRAELAAWADMQYRVDKAMPAPMKPC
jgi:hypothetical protein